MKPYLLVISTLLFSSNVFAEKTLQECIDTDNDIERLACYDSIFNQSRTPSSNFGSKSSSNNFGSERLKSTTPSPDFINARVVGEFNYLKKGDKIVLDNGQIWKVTDSVTYRQKASNPRVKISRSIMGSYLLELPGVNKRVKVTRVK